MRLSSYKDVFRFSALSMAALFLTASVSSCQKKTKSDDAEFSVLPEKPIVILGDTTNSGGTKVTGPWFSFRLKMSNKSDTSITVTALSITIYAEDTTGLISASDSGFSPTEFNFETNSNPSVKCEFVTFGTWSPGESKSFSLPSGVAGCTGYQPVFIIGGGKKGKSGHNFNYRVEVQPQGWFGTYDEPSDRLDTRFNFYTQ